MAKLSLDEVEFESPKGVKLSPDEVIPGGSPFVEPTRSEKILSFLKREGGAAGDAMMGSAKSAIAGASANIIPGVVLPAYDAVGETMNGRGGFMENFDRAQKERYDEYGKAAYDHPSTNILSSYALPAIGKGATALQRVATAVVPSALSAYFGSDPSKPDEKLAAGIVGGVAGGGLQAGSEVAAPAMGWAANGLRSAANGNAVNVMGGGRGQIMDKLGKIGHDPTSAGELGGRALDEGLIPWGLNPTKSPTESVYQSAVKLRQSAGNDIGSELGAADASSRWFDPASARARAESRYQTQNNPLADDNSGKANAFAAQIGRLDPQSSTGFTDANRMKSQAWDAANFKDDAPLQAKQYRKAVGGLASDISDQVGAAVGPESRERLLAANQRYETAADAEALSKPAANRETMAQHFGPTAALLSTLGGSIGMGYSPELAGGGLAAGAMLGGVLKSRGPTFLANAENNASKLANYGAKNINQSPAKMGAAAGATTSLLDQYLQKKPDEEREAEAADHLSRNGN